uniref:Uncharacterized protein n=1 Tax=Arundo donax TaxID=35708 RepID=A0A0A9DLH2_ARUDO
MSSPLHPHELVLASSPSQKP